MRKAVLKAKVAELETENKQLHRNLWRSVKLGSLLAEVAGRELGIAGSDVIQAVVAGQSASGNSTYVMFDETGHPIVEPSEAEVQTWQNSDPEEDPKRWQT